MLFFGGLFGFYRRHFIETQPRTVYGVVDAAGVSFLIDENLIDECLLDECRVHLDERRLDEVQ